MKTLIERVIRVAVIEDDRKFREGLVFLLNASAGLRSVAAVVDSAEALAKLPLLAPPPDVILLDLDLGHGKPDGVESLPALRKALPSTKCLILTALDQPDRVFEAVRRGACGYLRKSATSAELPEAIRDVHEGFARLSPDVFQRIFSALQNPPPDAKEWAKLTPREQEILELQALGFSPKEITARLSISYDTFKTHSQHIRTKLEVRTGQQAVRKVFPRKLLALLPRSISGGDAV